MSEAPVVVPPVVEAAAVVPPVVETPEAVAAAEPPWAKARVERGAREVIKKAGVKLAKGEPVEKGIDAIKDKVESQRARRKEAEKRADDAEAAVEGMKASIAALTAMQSLNEGQRAIISKLAGTDAAKQLEQIAIMQSLEAMKPPPAAAEAPAAIAAPATTKPAGSTPTPANASGEDVKSQYARLKANAQKNPIAAAQFALDHENELLGE